jgi:hydrogenase expression/formation protein HypE
MGRKLPQKISIGHGSGGSMTRDLVNQLFAKAFSNKYLDGLGDSSVLNINSENVAFTTDSYVVDPLIFPGGDIGKLAVCGTINDLSVAGADPKYLSAGFIIEEGLDMDILVRVVESMAREAKKAGVSIVTGDTKVVTHGLCDKLFINTAGIGIVAENNMEIVSGKNIQEGDHLIINGPIGDHAIAILTARSDIEMETDVKSDCATLNTMISSLLEEDLSIRFMRDATRGGLATVLVELASMTGHELRVYEDRINVSQSVSGVCDVLGFDPLYLANEGKVVMAVPAEHSSRVLEIMKQHPEGEDASVIGEVSSKGEGRVILHTFIGGSRVIDMLASDQLPRIC